LKFDFLQRHRILKGVLVLMIFSTIFIVNRGALVSARQHKDNASFAMNQEVVYVPDVMQLRLLTMGYDQAAADFVWLRTLSYFARHFTTDRQYPWLEYLLEQIIELDPHFTRVYHWAGANVLYGRRFTDENVFRSNRFYELALKNDPDDVEAAFRLGMNYSFELKGASDEQKDEFKRKGLAYLEMAANNPKSKHKLRSLVAGIAGKLGLHHLELSTLVDKLLHTTDATERQHLEERIIELESNLKRAGITKTAKRFEANRKRFLPYDDPSGHLFIQLGEPDADVITDVHWRTLLSDISLENDEEIPNYEETQRTE